ncbi:MAG: hypothetical protein B6244_14335 [Candidatus Cloacimonetes bacterium 4572_55]|nr:MAG: hypothetical protein B6244_14335 [Candidatus Cloacimonetes bacterium 4572_55]
MLQQCYISGLDRQAFHCLGLPLHPFTLGHARLLASVDSPIIADEPCTDMGALSVAVFICSHANAKDAQSALYDITEADFAAWGETLDMKNFDAEVKTFTEYLAYYEATPLRNDAETGSARAPWPWLYAWILLKDGVCHSREEVWQVICSDAFAWNACRCAYHNDKALMSDREVDFLNE